MRLFSFFYNFNGAGDLVVLIEDILISIESLVLFHCLGHIHSKRNQRCTKLQQSSIGPNHLAWLALPRPVGLTFFSTAAHDQIFTLNTY
jgi:hypothetical protein